MAAARCEPGRRSPRLCFALALLLILGLPASHAAIFNVNNTADAVDANPGNGVCATAGTVCTLRAAIQEANTFPGADVINLPAGTFTLMISGSDDVAAVGDLDITQSVTISGSGAASTTIDGNGLDRVLDVHGGIVAISDLTIRGGNIANKGGGIRNFANLTLTDSVVSNNTATEGGGVHMEGATSVLTVDSVLFYLNNAGTGGGIRLATDGSTATLTDVTFDGNVASNAGGGMAVEAADASLTRVTFTGNGANTGGGLWTKNGSSDVDLTNVTISGNTSSGEAGGIWAESNTLTLLNVTITNNTASVKGGGIRPKAGTQTFTNTIIAGNTPDQCERPVVSGGNNIDGGAICGFTAPESNLDPLLGPLQDNGGPTWTHELLAGSPAIDNGTNSGCPATDQRGTTRPLDGDGDMTATCDIGAFELVTTGISGRVFEDANFAGTAAGWDGGASDLALPNVDVELYTSGDVYVGSTTTDGSGNYSFVDMADGTYKVRVRSATIGDPDTAPAGGFNACVAATTCANPLPEMTWGNGAAAYGGQSATVDDTATGDNLGPGDTWLSIVVSGSVVSGVDFGFAYNLIVNTADDANAANVRSAQGSLRQFIKNANAIGSAASTTANFSEFHMQVPTNQIAGGDAWWRVTAAAAMTPFSDAGTTLDGSTQRTNSAADSNSRGPEIELFGGGVAGSGLEVNSIANTEIRELTINSFLTDGIYIHGAGANGTDVFGCYIGTDAVGENGLPNSGLGVHINGSATNTDIGSSTSGDGNLVSGNGGSGIGIAASSTSTTIAGNLIGTDRAGTLPLGNTSAGIAATDADGVTIGGSAAGAGNIVSANGTSGIVIDSTTRNVSIQGNSVGVGAMGSETTLGNGLHGIWVLSFAQPSNITIGGTGDGEGNLIAENVGSGVFLQISGSGDSVQGNTIRDNDAGGIGSQNDGVLIAKNLVAGNAGIGIQLDNDAGTGASNNKVYQNTVHGNTSDGILVAGDGVLLRNSIVTGNGGYGINVTTGSMTESDNLVTDAATAPANASGRSNVALDAGDLNLDPRYVDAAAGDFTLNECLSPAVEWGADLGVDQPDMNGATAGNFNGSAPDQGAFETSCTDPAIADLSLALSDSPDPAPLGGPLVYTIVVTNNGPGTATNVTLTDNLPASTTFVSATPSQGTCSGTGPVSCDLGAIVNGGTASVEILVTTSVVEMITNNASVTASQTDLVPANDADSEDTDVVVTTGISDVPLTQYSRLHGFLDYTVTGGSLRTGEGGGGASCGVAASSTASLSGIPASGTVVAAYLYWGGSGATVDSAVTFGGTAITADRTFQGIFTQGGADHDFFGGFADVTSQIEADRNGNYTFEDLTVDTGDPYCTSRLVIAGWSLFVVYDETTLSAKTLALYDGFDIERNSSTSYSLTGIYAAAPPEAKTTFLLWEGDSQLGTGGEELEFNGTDQSDGDNPPTNTYNSTINTLGVTDSHGVDLDTFDVSGLVSGGDTVATTRVGVGPDLVILNTVVLQVKSNIVVGMVFEDVNYGGGPGRDLATSAAAAPSFTVPRPGATVELYSDTGVFLRTTTTGANGRYDFAGLTDGDYQVRVVNQTVDSSRPGASGGEWPVQTFRTDASSGTAVPVTGKVGGADPTLQDSGANTGMLNLSAITAQSVSPVQIGTGVTVPAVDFGFNFDTIVNTKDSGQGSLRQFILNSNNLTNANLDQDTLTAGTEHSLFMIPVDADPYSRTPDPGWDALRGVAVITPDALLDPVTDDDTAVDGTTQETGVRDSNTTTLGTGGNVGVDAFGLPQLDGPDIEIVDDIGLTIGLDLQANDATVRGIAIYGFGSGNSNGNIRAGSGAASNFTGIVIEDNAVGSFGDSFTDPDLTLAGSGTPGSNIVVLGPDGGTIRRNLVGFAGSLGAHLTNGADDWTVELNEIRRNGLDQDRLDGISTGSARTIIQKNLIADNQGAGVDFFASTGSHTVDNNTIEGNGWGGVETTGIRMFSTDSEITRNIIRNQTGSGVLAVVEDLAFTQTPALRNKISQNAFSGNGSNAIDLQTTLDIIAPGDGITPNDGTLLGDSSNPTVCGTDATHGNNGLDTPIVDLVLMTGGTAKVRGRACPLTDVEIYRAVADGDSSDTLSGTDYGEGVEYLATATAAAGTGLFEATGVTGLSAGDRVSAIAIDSDGNTSEFSNNVMYQSLAIVKRAFQLDGTPISSGSTLPAGMPVKFLLYIDNPGNMVADVSLQDVLAALFGYQAGSIKVDNALDSATVCPGGTCNEATIFAKVDGTPNVCGMSGSECTDNQDADPVSLSGTTIYAGDGVQTGNAQLDLPAGKVWAISFTIIMQ